MKGFISLTLPTIQPGHIDVVEFCKNRCNELLIGLTSDELCLRDNIDTVADFNTRSSILKSIFPNIEIFCQNTWSGEDILRKHLPKLKINVKIGIKESTIKKNNTNINGRGCIIYSSE